VEHPDDTGAERRADPVRIRALMTLVNAGHV